MKHVLKGLLYVVVIGHLTGKLFSEGMEFGALCKEIELKQNND